MIIDRATKWASSKPEKLFLFDGFGAMLSAFLLGVVLVELETVFGIPSSTLYLLASLPLLFAAYDFFFYFKKDIKQGIPLKGIAILNYSYCLLSLFLAFYHTDVITALGWLYILTEVLIVSVLASFELRVANWCNLKLET